MPGYNNAVSSRFAIVNRCPKRWADLLGNGRRRYCDDCNKHVHSIEQYSSEEWDRIWRESDGRPCGMICGPSPPESRSRRVILFGALLTAISPLMAQTGRLRILVIDVTGAVIPTVSEASLLGADGKPIRTLHANTEGEIVWTDLSMGDCRFVVSAPGFRARQLLATIRNGDEAIIEVILEVPPVGVVVSVEGPAPKPPPHTVAPPATESKRPKRRRWLIFPRDSR
jgi:hypothetical protein